MTALPPTGTLTFLFTDIDGGTHGWGDSPEAISAALFRHDELLRAAVTGNGGGIFRHTGDGVSAVFASPYDALAAAVAAQRALRAEPWGALGDLPVRMGLHVGWAEHRMGDYFGPTLNRVARLTATAHGGQVVVSLPAQEIVRDELPYGLALLDLGEHHLADFARPERIFQVVHPDLPATFPALRSLAVDRHNLPLALTNFVGRQTELERVARLIGTARLVTVTGVGGAGKTRLALRAAADALDAFADGVFLVELGPLTEPELVPAALSTALGVGGSSPEGLSDYLRSRRLLLVLDNCEHLIDAAAQLCEVLLSRCADLTILATSREPLAVPGEVVWRIPSLSLPPKAAAEAGELSGDAVALFCDRARSVDPEFRLSAENTAAVARICHRLDGIPLALELAAARLRMLRPEQVAERLEDRLGLLTGGGRNALARHQTLRAALDWSHDLLSEPERTLLGRLAVFAGSFSIEAAEAVGSDGQALRGAEVLDLLGLLVDKSLVAVETGEREARYRLLAIVRQYAREKLDAAGDAGVVERRHRDFFLRRLDEDGEVFLEEWASYRWVGSDRENIRLALQWSLIDGDVDAALRLGVALRGYWSLSETLGEGTVLLEQCLAQAGEQPSRAAMQARITLGFLHLQQGATARAKAHLDGAVLDAERLADASGLALARGFLGVCALQSGDLATAESLFAEGVFGLRETRPGYAAWFQVSLSWVALARGDVARAAQLLEAVLASVEVRTNENLAVHALAALAPIVARAGERDRAERLAEQAVEQARGLEVRRILVMALIRATEVASLLGSDDRAATFLAEVLPLLRKTAGTAWVADAVELTGLSLGSRGRHEPAVRLLAACDALRTASGESAEIRAVHARRQAYEKWAASALGAAKLQDQQRRGSNLTREDMVREALAEILADPPTDAPSGTARKLAAGLSGTARQLAEDPSEHRSHMPADASSGADRPSAVMRRRGQTWELGHHGVTAHLRPSKGLADLAVLLARPDTDVHVLELATPDADGARTARAESRGADVLDRAALAAYRRRLAELDAEEAEAADHHDEARLARLDVEREALLGELRGAVGLGGRSRALGGDAAQRARTAVTGRVRDAIRRIAAELPDLGAHLDRSIRTGTTCRYSPTEPLTWTFD